MTKNHAHVHFAEDLPHAHDEEEQRPLLEMILRQQAKIEELDEKIRTLEGNHDKEDFLPHHKQQAGDIAIDEGGENRSSTGNAEDGSEDGEFKTASQESFVDNVPAATTIVRTGSPKSILLHHNTGSRDSAISKNSAISKDGSIGNSRKGWVYNLHVGPSNMDDISEIPLHYPSTIHHHHHHKNSSMRHSVFRGSLGLTDDQGDDEQDILVSDTFTLMMLADVASLSWVLGISSFLFQLILGGMVAYEMVFVQSTGTSIFNVPFKASIVVRSGQFFTIVLCLVTQKDVLSAIQTFVLLRPSSDWDVFIQAEDHRSNCRWFVRVFIPNSFKLIQGVLVIFVSYVTIVQSNNIIDLLKNYTALMVLSETDNIMFHLASYGYLGGHLKEETIRAQQANAVASEILDEEHHSYFIRSAVLILLFFSMLAGWISIMVYQDDGTYFDSMYPDCGSANFKLANEHFYDGKCYGGPLNSLECEFEGGDCINFNLAYPDCRNVNFTSVQEKVGDGICDEHLNITGCGFDGGDCI